MSLALSSIMRYLWKSLIFPILILLSFQMERVTLRHYLGSLPSVIIYSQEGISLTFGEWYSGYISSPQMLIRAAFWGGSWADSIWILHRNDPLPRCSCPLSCLRFRVKACNGLWKELASLNIPGPQFCHFYLLSSPFIGHILAPGCYSLTLTI